MAYLLGQIILCLVLAAFAGWVLGWGMRASRDRDRLEDLRRTLRATEDVKDRELAEAYRRSEAECARTEAAERVARELEAGMEQERRSAQLQEEALADARRQLAECRERLDEERRTSELATQGAAAAAKAVADAEQRLRECESMLSGTRSEADALRRDLEARATTQAELERRLIELEGAADREAAAAGEIEILQTRHAEEIEKLTSELGDLRRRTADDEALKEGVRERDRAINELRIQLQEAVAAREHGRAETVAAESALQQTRSELQQQVQGAQRQSSVHRSVVANLRADVERLRRELAQAEDDVTRARDQYDAQLTLKRQWQSLISDRDEEIEALRARLGRVTELESRLAERERQIDRLRAALHRRNG